MRTAKAIAKDYGMGTPAVDMTDNDIRDWAIAMKVRKLADVEYAAVMDALFKSGYNKTLTAKALGISYQQLRYRLIKWGNQAWEG